jgi:alanyl-tRNA synthetase
MVTRILYYEEPYLSQFEATVLAMDDDGRVYLDRTAFSPRGGGCPGDTGFIGDAQVMDTQMNDRREIAHVVSNSASLEPGMRVATKLDWDRRLRIMRLHSASHLMENFLFSQLGELERVGNFLTESGDKCTYEYGEAMSPELITRVNEACQSFIDGGGAIETYADVQDVQLRYWRCKGVVTLCGGVHLRDIAEVGKIKISRQSGGKGRHTIVTRLTSA